jgi:hypothetical protein
MDATWLIPVTPSGFRLALDLDTTSYGGPGVAMTVRLAPPPWRKPRWVENVEQHCRVCRNDGRTGYGTETPDSGRLLGLSVLLRDVVLLERRCSFWLGVLRLMNAGWGR